MRRSPDPILTLDFKVAALRSPYRYTGPEEGAPMMIEGGPACWLKQHDALDRPCSDAADGHLEAIHVIGRKAIRRILSHNLNTGYIWQEDGGINPNDVEDLIELAEWDPRNGSVLGCTGHHRRFDSHATPELKLDADALTDDFLDFVLDWGLESEAEKKFGGQVAEVLELREIQREGVAW